MGMSGKTALGAATIVAVAGACSGASSGRPSHLASEPRAAALHWGSEQKLLASDAAELDQFGGAVSLAGDTAVVGAFGESSGRGAAYVFSRNGGAWGDEHKLTASDGADLDRFGSSVSAAADRLLVGAYGADAFRGAAYVFARPEGAWAEEQKLAASGAAAGDNFGYAVSLAGDTALVGAHGAGGARGVAYVFVRSGGAWIEEQKLVATDAAADDSFGWSVSLAVDRALVGAPGKDGARGAAYVFVRSGSVWREEQKLVATDGVAFDNFGNAVSLAAGRALVAAYWKHDFRGAAYVFAKTGGAWAVEQKLAATDGATGRFGNAVALQEDRALIGAFAHGDGRGAAYTFSLANAAAEPWREGQRLVASDVQADLFGWSVALAGESALVGAIYSDQLRGAAYAFSLGVDDRDGGAADGADAQDDGSAEAGAPGPVGCTRGDECASGHCEDGICCDRTCTASERCRSALKVSGDDGVCGPAKAAAPGVPCRFDVQCTSGRCRGGLCEGDSPMSDGGCAAVGTPPADNLADLLKLALVVVIAWCGSRSPPRAGMPGAPRSGGGRQRPRSQQPARR
jgi:hypothetical protein